MSCWSSVRSFLASLFILALVATSVAAGPLINPYIFNACAAGISLVGTPTTSSALGNATHTLNLPSGMIQGDFVFVQYAYGDEGTGSTVIDSGWTQEAFVDAGQINYKLFRKIMGASPDTSVSFTAFDDASEIGVTIASAWRCVDQTTPIDVAIPAASITADPPSATPATNGAIAIVVAGVRSNDTTGNGAPTGYTGFLENGAAGGSRQATTYFAYKTGLSAGVAEDPSTFTGLSTSSIRSFTVILRPQL